MALKVRRSKRTSGSGAREAADQIVSLSRRCEALEREVALLAFSTKLDKAVARIAALEENP